jgi:hypothetical protein
MTNVERELARQYGDGADDPMAAFDAAISKASKGEGGAKQRIAPEPKRGKGRHAPQHEKDPLWSRQSLQPTDRRTAEGKPIAKLSSQALETFLRQEGSASVQDNLVIENPNAKPAEPRKTAEEWREIARQRDPESWARAEAMRKQKFEQGREESADVAELHAHRMTQALESENEALIISRGREFASASPTAWRAYCSELSDAILQDYADAGIDPDDEDHIAESDLIGNVLIAEVGRALEQERAHEMLARSQSMVEGLTALNSEKYGKILAEAGIDPSADDPGSVERYLGLKDYIAVSTGVDVGELSRTDPETAGAWMTKAAAQIDNWDSQLRTHALTKSFLEEEDGSVASGLVSGADETARLLREQNDLLRAQQGLGPAGEPEAPPV